MPEPSIHQDDDHTYSKATLGNDAKVIFGNVYKSSREYSSKMLFHLEFISSIVVIILLILMLMLRDVYHPW